MQLSLIYTNFVLSRFSKNSTISHKAPFYDVLLKISENLNISRKPLVLRTCTARCQLLYLSTIRHPTGVFISAHVSEILAVFFTPFACVSANIEMVDVKEQRICIQFCFKFNKTAAETH
jgi:hypothetical protein